jgi:alcohol dehydrogenase
MKTMAAVLREIGLPAPYATSRPLSIEEVELDPPGPAEVLVKIRAAGLCHSDLSAINGDRPWPMPIVVGHEAAGEVLEVGSAVDDLKPGDHVVMVFRPMCGVCESCQVGRPALCGPGGESNASGSLLGGYKRLRAAGGGPMNHHLGVSAFAQHAVASRRSMVKVDSSLPFDEAALFGCAVMTGAGAVLNTARCEAGAHIGVVGLGGVGFSSLLAGKAIGARSLIAVDMLDSKLELAKQLGATACIRADAPDVIDQIKALTGGGVDYAFEMAGSVPALELAYRITRRGGTTVTAGLPHPEKKWPLQAVSLIAEERTVKGSYVGSCVPSRDIPRFVTMYQQGHLPVDALLSERLQLSEINEGFDRLARGEAIRQVVVM